jgi:hypothetical protein
MHGFTVYITYYNDRSLMQAWPREKLSNGSARKLQYLINRTILKTSHPSRLICLIRQVALSRLLEAMRENRL